jgi:hypothetical protein
MVKHHSRSSAVRGAEDIGERSVVFTTLRELVG